MPLISVKWLMWFYFEPWKSMLLVSVRLMRSNQPPHL
jgi:hypothetical protein